MAWDSLLWSGMNVIAVTASALVLALGALSLFRESGYEFDLRRKSRSRAGRRASDRRAA
jgi:hypothetical protein